MDKQKQIILHEKLPKVMWQLSWPAVVAMVLYGMNNFLDGIFVGHLINNTALAAVGVAYPLAQFAQGFGTLIGTGMGSAISIWIGANERDKLSKSFGTVNFLTILFSLLITVPCYLFAKELVYMMGGRGEILAMGVEYFQATILGSFFWIYGLAMNMIVRAEGRMKTAAWMIAVGLVVDVALKPVFIHTFGWGGIWSCMGYKCFHDCLYPFRHLVLCQGKIIFQDKILVAEKRCRDHERSTFTRDARFYHDGNDCDTKFGSV